VQNHHDDARQQPWQFDLGMTHLPLRLPVVLVATIIAPIWMRRTDRAPAADRAFVRQCPWRPGRRL
jgi:hypothetical protein